MCDHNVQLPVKRVERVDVPAVLVEASHAIGRAVAEEPIQYFHLRRSTEINILPDFRGNLLFKMSMRLLLKIGPLEVLS